MKVCIFFVLFILGLWIFVKMKNIMKSDVINIYLFFLNLGFISFFMFIFFIICVVVCFIYFEILVLILISFNVVVSFFFKLKLLIRSVECLRVGFFKIINIV